MLESLQGSLDPVPGFFGSGKQNKWTGREGANWEKIGKRGQKLRNDPLKTTFYFTHWC